MKDYQIKLNKVFRYIEQHLNQPIKLEELASVACLSPYHFHRIFTACTGETLNNYIRRTKVELAANRLLFTDDDVTIIGLEAGYETPAAFGKAFKQRFGVAPGVFRKLNQPELLRQQAQFMIMEDNTVTPEIKNQPNITVLYVRKTGPYDKAAEEAWGTLMGYAYSNQLMEKETKRIGIPRDNPDITDEDRLRYDACITVDRDIKPGGDISTQEIAGGKYAVFLHKGSYYDLGDTYQKIFSGWVMQSDAKLRDEPPYEIYLNRDPRRTKPENLRTEIYIPIE